MPTFTYQQDIRKLEQRKGGYHYLEVPSETIDQFEKKRKTRLICTIDQHLSYSCGLNHLGNGNYFIILSNANLKKLGKVLGDTIEFEISEDPNPLGVEIPEDLAALLEQDEDLNNVFQKISDGKKRRLIFDIRPMKSIDKRIDKIILFLEQEQLKLKKKA